MLILYAVAFGFILGFATKGRIKYFPLRILYWKALALSALAIQLVIFSELAVIKALPETIIITAHVISYILLFIFIGRNYKNFGITFIGAGIFLNSLVIFLNGGYMPTIPENLRKTSLGASAALIDQGQAVNNSSKITSETLLPWLADIFYLPDWVPLSNVFSIGDIVVAIGICIYIVINMHPLPGNDSSGTRV